jgi:cell division protein FtsB
MKVDQKSKKLNITAKLGILFLIFVTAFLTNLKYKQFKTQKAIETEKNNLLEQSEILNKKNRELEESLSYLTSENFKEKIAREQLNLKKEGETAYSFTEKKILVTDLIENQKQKKPNYEKWLEYFFKN